MLFCAGDGACAAKRAAGQRKKQKKGQHKNKKKDNAKKQKGQRKQQKTSTQKRKRDNAKNKKGQRKTQKKDNAHNGNMTTQKQKKRMRKHYYLGMSQVTILSCGEFGPRGSAKHSNGSHVRSQNGRGAGRARARMPCRRASFTRVAGCGNYGGAEWSCLL